jgi:hypothetical protein
MGRLLAGSYHNYPIIKNQKLYILTQNLEQHRRILILELPELPKSNIELPLVKPISEDAPFSYVFPIR